MAIGDLLHQTPVTTPDPYTGCPVTRLTPPDHTSHHMYFYNRMVTSDSSRLLYCAEINGRRNLYLMELATGDAVQLTEGDALDDYGAMISADDKSVYYQQDRKVWKLDLATLQRTCLYAAPDGWDCGNWGMSDDNRYLVMTETRRDTLPDLTGKKGWEFFPLTCAAKPLCHIVYLDTQTGEHHIVVEDRCWFGHAQLRPGDPDTILFCHEGPYDMIDARLWLIQSDGSRYRCARPQPKDVIITHEFWMPTGDRLAYVYRKADDGSTETIRMMRPETLEEELFITYNRLDAAYDQDVFTRATLRGKLDVNAMEANRSLYSHVIYDSDNERRFAQELDVSDQVAVYVKLPGSFYISTPVGKYNPDWAIAFNEGSVKHIYFVAETKGNLDTMELRGVENAKIECTKKHFAAISNGSVVYSVVDNYSTLMQLVSN